MKRKFSFAEIFLFLFFLTAGKIFSQPTELLQTEKQNFFFDAISFQGVADTAERVDIFVLVPNQILQFSGSDNFFAAQYRTVITVFDSTRGKKIREERIERRVTAQSYSETRGSAGSADIIQRVLSIPPGSYRIEVLLIDALSKAEMQKSRSVNVPAYRNFPFGMSGTMLLSAVEQTGQRTAITPHISDNVGMLTEGFFAFFETYNRAGHDSADFVYEIIDSKGNNVAKGQRVRQSVQNPRAQHFINIIAPKNLLRGSYVLRITALRPSTLQNFSQNDIIALSERSVSIERTIAGFVLTDLDKAIRQLRYIANQSEMSAIESAKSQEDRQEKFSEFWKNLDPTANTERNEAFEDYYARIEYVNKNYRSYTEGWLTDMGMIYVIFGPPDNVDRQNRGNGRQTMIWTYQSLNRQFVFTDASGFGDYRLNTAVSSLDKYRYGR